MTPILDPRNGDIEDDAASTKRRSLLSLMGSLLPEISLPKLAIVWMLLIGFPGLLLGVKLPRFRGAFGGFGHYGPVVGASMASS